MTERSSEPGFEPAEGMTDDEAYRSGKLLGEFCGSTLANRVYQEFARGFSDGFSSPTAARPKMLILMGAMLITLIAIIVGYTWK